MHHFLIMKDSDFKVERGLESESSLYEKWLKKVDRTTYLVTSVILTIAIGGGVSLGIYFGNIEIREKQDNNLLFKRVLKSADTNNNGILEQSELSVLIKEIEPGYVMPKIDGYLLDIGGNEISIASGEFHPTPTIYLPKSKLEEYLAKHK